MQRFQRIVKNEILKRRIEKTLERLYKTIRSRRYKHCVIKELLQTEFNYIKDLEVIEYIRDNLGCSIQYQASVFMNVTQLRKENQLFYNKINTNFTNYSHQATLFAGIDVSGFKEYFFYCSHYNDALKQLNRMLEVNQDLSIALKGFSEKLRGMQLTDFLIKPIQRLPKYLLLLRDLQKHTPQEHPDWENINNLFQQFEKLNDENNKSMDKLINRAQVKQISDDYNDKSIYTENPDRLLLHEDAGNIILQDKELNVRLYFFTDLILVGQMEKVIQKFKIDAQTLIKDQEDTKYFTNLFSIVNKDSVLQFSANHKAQKEKQIHQLEKMLAYLKKSKDLQSMDPIKVKVVGTEERFSYSINKYTVYIVEIEIVRIVLKIYLRFSRAVELLAIFKQRYPSIKLSEFGANHWLDNHSTKVIEQRGLWIENMIQQVLMHGQTQQEIIQQHQESTLSLLTLPDDFYQLPQQNLKIDDEIKHQFVSRIGKMEDEICVSDLLDRNFSAMGSQIRVSTIKDSGVQLAKYCTQDRNSMKLHPIKVHYIDDTFEELLISDTTRAAEIVKIVARELKIACYQDFRIILEDKYLNRRVIDDDEVIAQLHQMSVKGVFNSSLNILESFWTNSDTEKLLFRKVIFLEPQCEQAEIKRNPERLEWLVKQYFKEISEAKFVFHKKNLFYFTAFYFNIYEKQLTTDDIQKFLGKEIYHQIKPAVWFEEIKVHQTEIASKATPHENENKSLTHIQKFQFLLQIFKQKESTMNIYKLELHRDTLKILEKKIHYSNLYLGLSVKKIWLLSPQDKSVIVTIEYDSITKIQSFPNKLILLNNNKVDIEQGTSPEWKFVTFQSYEIKMLIQFYQSLK